VGRLFGSASSITVITFRFFDADEGLDVDLEALKVFFVTVNVFVFRDFDLAISVSGHSTGEDLRASLPADAFDTVELFRVSPSSSSGSRVVLLVFTAPVFLRFGAESAVWLSKVLLVPLLRFDKTGARSPCDDVGEGNVS
jgi:hypothetical protein